MNMEENMHTGKPDRILFLGDINFKGVEFSRNIFSEVEEEIKSADIVFANLECSLSLGKAREYRQAFSANPDFGPVLRKSGIGIVGNANNVNFGSDAILASNKVLADAGIIHVGSGANIQEALQPNIWNHGGRKYGYLQKTAVFWPVAHAAERDQPGVATIAAHTSYRPVLDHHAALTRPGVPPEIITWADKSSLRQVQEEIAALRRDVDFVVSSFHWGYRREVLSYQTEFARAAIDAGADIVFGHGPHTIAPLERYKNKLIIYGMGNFVFHVAHTDDVHASWLGMIARLAISGTNVCGIELAFVEKGENNKPLITRYLDHRDEFDRLEKLSRRNDVSIKQTDDEFWFRAEL